MGGLPLPWVVVFLGVLWPLAVPNLYSHLGFAYRRYVDVLLANHKNFLEALQSIATHKLLSEHFAMGDSSLQDV